MKLKIDEFSLDKIAERISDFLVSLAFLLPVFFAFMGYRYYEVQSLFAESLTMIKNANSRYLASVLIAIVAVSTTLIFMVNSSKMAPINIKGKEIHWSKLLLVLFAFIINYFFWKPWEGKSIQDTQFRWFCCIMLSSMDYGFAHLFKELHRITKGEQLLTNIEQAISTKKHELSSLKHNLTSLEQKYKKIEQLVHQHTCPHCQEVFHSMKSLNAHKGICKSKNHT